MGQAKQRGTREERVAQAKARPKEKKLTVAALKKDPAGTLAALKRMDVLFSGLTTPSDLDDQVSEFARELTGNEPIFLDCQPEPWSRQSCCDLNVAKYIEEHDGEMLCGYRIWYTHPRYIEGERHAVWTNGEVIRDVSFSDTGETRVVFVKDNLGFEDAPGKVRKAFSDEDKDDLAIFDLLNGQIPTAKMSEKKAWDTSITYEDWLAGARMSNQQIITRS